MAIRHGSQKEHDLVIDASAKTYEQYEEKGYVVSINPTGQQNREVFPGLYPDLVVWLPDGKLGRTVIIEEIETEDSVTERESQEWARFSKLRIKFFLVVPKDSATKAAEIIKRRNIRVDRLQCYFLDNYGQVKFATGNHCI